MNEEILNQFVGKITIVELDCGRTFCSKLAQIDGDLIWFRNSKGTFIMNRRNTIRRIYEYIEPIEIADEHCREDCT